MTFLSTGTFFSLLVLFLRSRFLLLFSKNLIGVLRVKLLKFQAKCRFGLGLEKPDPRRALQSAFTIAISYVVGGIVPLIPYIFIPVASRAVLASVAITLIALFVFGFAKGYFTGNNPIRSALQTALIGAVASAAAFGMAKAVQG